MNVETELVRLTKENDNFKKIIETECPNEDGKYYGSRWVETDTELIIEWFEIDPPQEEFLQENS